MNPTQMTNVAILARAPFPGEAKTRLIPMLGASGAASLQTRLMRQTVRTAVAADLGRVVLWGAPDHRHPAFADCAEQWPVTLRSQPAGDLGERMLEAIWSGAGPSGVLVVGTDCPALTPAHLIEAAATLSRGNDVVLIPAEDGGYVLIGMRRAEPAVFEGIAWGTARVLAQTRVKLAHRGLRWVEMPTLWDVDRPNDVVRLRGWWPEFLHDAVQP